jgi:hypothetical protein
MNHRPRRLTTVLTVVVVVVVVGGLAYVGSHRSSTHPAKVATPTTSTAAQVRTTVTATTAAGAHRHAGKHAGHHRATTPTTTTAPAQLVPVSTSGAAATYAVSTDQYQVAVSATGPCWVLATSTATGATVWTGTLQAGAVQNIEATGGLTLELGAPAVSLTVDHVPVVLPNPFHTPFVATFQPAATAPTGTAPTGSDGTAGGLTGPPYAGPGPVTGPSAPQGGPMTSLDLLVDAFERVRDAVHPAVGGLTPEELAFRPAAESNSIAWLVWHLTRIQDDHVAALAGTEQMWTIPPWWPWSPPTVAP